MMPSTIKLQAANPSARRRRTFTVPEPVPVATCNCMLFSSLAREQAWQAPHSRTRQVCSCSCTCTPRVWRLTGAISELQADSRLPVTCVVWGKAVQAHAYVSCGCQRMLHSRRTFIERCVSLPLLLKSQTGIEPFRLSARIIK